MNDEQQERATVQKLNKCHETNKSRALTIFLCLFIFLDKIFTGILIEGGHISEANILISTSMNLLGVWIPLLLAGTLSTICVIVIHYAQIDGNVKTFIQTVLLLIYALILLLHVAIIFDIFKQA